jgi:hypothetical protein
MNTKQLLFALAAFTAAVRNLLADFCPVSFPDGYAKPPGALAD